MFLPKETIYLGTRKHYFIVNVQWNECTRDGYQCQVSNVFPGGFSVCGRAAIHPHASSQGHSCRVLVEVGKHVGERVRIAGWLHSLRRLGGVNFLIIRDAWGIVQVVTETEVELGPLQDGQLGVESIVAVEGVVVSEAQAPGGVELHQPRIEIITPVTEVPPVPPNKRKITASIGTLLDHAVVTNRHPARRAVLRLAAGAMTGFRATLSTQTRLTCFSEAQS